MGRKRFITSDMSIDERLAQVAAQDQVAALMWPWFITGFDDCGRMPASPLRIKLAIFPGFDFSVEQIQRAIELYARTGLVHLYEVEGRDYIAIDPRKWYKHQSYIPESKRDTEKSQYPPPPDPPWARDDAETSAYERTRADISRDQRDDAQGSGDELIFVPSPSPSPSIEEEEEEYISRARDQHTTDWSAWYQEHFGGPPPKRWRSKIDDLVKKGVSAALVVKALEAALAAGADHPLSWASTQLSTWFARGIRSPTDFESGQTQRKAPAPTGRSPPPDPPLAEPESVNPIYRDLTERMLREAAEQGWLEEGDEP